MAGVILDAEGNLYGTATKGGGDGAGVVCKLDTAHQETVLYSFSKRGPSGGGPYGGVILDSAGNLSRKSAANLRSSGVAMTARLFPRRRASRRNWVLK